MEANHQLSSRENLNLYSVHVGNVPIRTTETQVLELFAPTGDVKNVFVQPSSLGHTYAFVRYKTLEEANKACTMMNRKQLDGNLLIVSLSEHTKNRLSSDKDMTGRSITRDRLPNAGINKYTCTPAEENALHRQLKLSLNTLNDNDKFTEWLGITCPKDVESFMRDFKNVLVNMAAIPQSVGAEPFKFEELPTNKTSLQKMIIRYHERKEPRQLFKEVDISVTDSKQLSTEDVNKYFPNQPFKVSSNESFEGKLPICNYDEYCKIKRNTSEP